MIRSGRSSGTWARAAVGEQFKFADFVDDRALADFPQQRAHVAGDDQSARRGIELFGAFQDFHRAAGPRQQRRREKTGSGAADDGDLLAGFASLLFQFPAAV